jgi:hypothetical protein
VSSLPPKTAQQSEGEISNKIWVEKIYVMIHNLLKSLKGLKFQGLYTSELQNLQGK